MSDSVNIAGHDNLFATPINNLGKFVFDQNVVNVFPDMIKRSVPGYTTIIAMIGDLAGRYAQANSTCYDLGCSLGAATLAMRHQIHAANCGIVGIDSSSAMIERCQAVIDADARDVPVTLLCQTLQDSDISNASVVVLNFTLQFIPLADRQTMINKIFQGLRPGGVLIVSEKVCFEDSQHQSLMIELHHNFKRANGYSDLEIAQKRDSIDNVLIPETLNAHRQRLKAAGFSDADVWFQCLNFASLIAQK